MRPTRRVDLPGWFDCLLETIPVDDRERFVQELTPEELAKLTRLMLEDLDLQASKVNAGIARLSRKPQCVRDLEQGSLERQGRPRGAGNARRTRSRIN